MTAAATDEAEKRKKDESKNIADYFFLSANHQKTKETHRCVFQAPEASSPLCCLSLRRGSTVNLIFIYLFDFFFDEVEVEKKKQSEETEKEKTEKNVSLFLKSVGGPSRHERIEFRCLVLSSFFSVASGFLFGSRKNTERRKRRRGIAKRKKRNRMEHFFSAPALVLSTSAPDVRPLGPGSGPGLEQVHAIER